MAWCPRSSDAWSMHTVAHMPFACCFLPENEEHGPALPADSPPWQRSRGIYSLLPLLQDSISQDSCISSQNVSPKFNYHLMLFVANTLPLPETFWQIHLFFCFIPPNWTGLTHFCKLQAAPLCCCCYRTPLCHFKTQKGNLRHLGTASCGWLIMWFRDLIQFEGSLCAVVLGKERLHSTEALCPDRTRPVSRWSSETFHCLSHARWFLLKHTLCHLVFLL